MTVRHRHNDQADGAQLISLWEYLWRAAERTSRQEEQAAEQLSPFWGTSLAMPLPGTGSLRCESAPASSASRRQRRRRRAPVLDSVAGRGDALAPCSTGGPHDTATPGSGARSPPLSGFAPEERTAEPPTSAAPTAASPQHTAAAAPAELVTLTAASAEPSSPPPAAARMTSSPEGSRHREDSGGRLLCFHGGSTRHGFLAAVFPGICGRIPSPLCWSAVVGATSNPSLGPGRTAVSQQGVHEGTLCGVRCPSDGVPSGPASCALHIAGRVSGGGVALRSSATLSWRFLHSPSRGCGCRRIARATAGCCQIARATAGCCQIARATAGCCQIARATAGCCQIARATAGCCQIARATAGCCQIATAGCCQIATAGCCQIATAGCCQIATAGCCQIATAGCCQIATAGCCQIATAGRRRVF
ncbi:hypothetical protein CRENBAI_002709 [Crenichthys baileyi]|uniref:Uncharacterized protein n=1 Tax=Crenichthys baileyi TaxID=28760 RepID=A0AAV9RW44_9TELE